MQNMCALILSLSLAVVALGQQAKPYICTGKVIDSKAQPVVGAEVICYELFYDYERGQFTWKIIGRAKNGEDGRFRRQVMVTDRRNVWVAARKQGLSLGCKEAIQNSTKLDFIIQLDEPEVLAGVIVDENGIGIVGARVQMCLKDEQAGREVSFRVPEDWFTTKTDSQGKFSFDDIPTNATADFWVEAPGKVCCWTFWESNGDAGMQYESGQKDIRIVLGQEAKILGQVIDENTGVPVEGIQLLARPDKGWANYYCAGTVISDLNGQFCLKGLPAGIYSLQIVSPQDKMTDWVGRDVKVLVEAGKTVSDIKVPVSKGAIFELTLRDDQTNQPIEGVSVNVSQKANYGKHYCYYKSVVTDETGTVRLRVPPGECDFWAGSDVYASSSSRGYFKNMEPMTAEKGKITRQEIRLIRNPHVSGIVHDPNGQPAVGAVVASKPVCIQSVRTGADGRFEVSWRSRSSIRKKFILAQDAQNNLAGLVELKDEAEPIDIRLGPAFKLKGQVADPNVKPIDNAAVKLHASLPGWITNVGERVLTDANGFYQISAVPPPQSDFTYSIEIEATNYGPERTGQISFDDNPARLVEIDTTVLKPADRSVSGIVVDSEDKPAAGIRIYVNGPRGSRMSGQPERRAVTDKQGKFLVKHVCKGPLRIQAGFSSDPKGAGFLDAQGGDKDVKVILGQSGAHVPYVSIEGKQLPELKDLGIELLPADIEGKRILVCFFDMEQRPSRHCITQLIKQAEQLKDKGVVIVAVQGSKIDKNALDEWAKESKVPFSVGMIQDDAEKARLAWGVRSLPWLILTDTSHIVVSQGFNVGDLNNRLGQGSQ